MHGLADYWVYNFAEQRPGVIWIGTWYGANRFDTATGKFWAIALWAGKDRAEVERKIRETIESFTR